MGQIFGPQEAIKSVIKEHMSQVTKLPEPPRGFEGTAKYTMKPREKRAFHTVLDARNMLDTSPDRGGHVQLSQADGQVVFTTKLPILRGEVQEEIRFERTGGGLLTKSLTRKLLGADGHCTRLEDIAAFRNETLSFPDATYPEVSLPFCLGWFPLDGTRRSIYAWINDRFVAKVYVETAGRSRITLPIGTRDAVEVIMYPDLNDWISLGSVLTRLAKPFVPKYYMWFEPEAPHRLLRFEGPYGPPGAPELTLELASISAG